MAVAEQEEFETSEGKSLSDLGREAAWFAGHTIFAVLALLLMMAVVTLFHPNADAVEPKLIGTLLAFVVPMGFGFLIAKKQQNEIARYVWISGLLFFSIVCVWVLDLPTGNGLCEHCLALEKLYRTFFDITNGSGLMGGDGLFIGTWIPLALFGYAVGASQGLDEPASEE